MSDLIRVDFANRRRVVEEPTSDFPTAVGLRETSGYDRPELLDRLAVILARLSIAKREGDELEVQDLAGSLEEHTKAIVPEITQEEIALINRQANQVMDQL